MIDWDDLRILLALMRGGSTHAAARALKVNQSTVQRRISVLEQDIGQRLFQRLPSGYRATPLADTLRPGIEAVEAAVLGLDLQIAALARKDALRLTCPGPLVGRLSRSALLAGFHAAHPRIRVEILIADGYLDLSAGEADVALRSGKPGDARLVGRRVGDSIWAVYGARAFVAQNGQPADVAELARFALVGFDGELAGHRAAEWLAREASASQIVARSNSVLGVLQAVRAGVGLAPLPRTIAAMHEDLVEVLPPIAELDRGWYLLTTPDLRREPHVATFIEHVHAHLPELRAVLMG